MASLSREAREAAIADIMDKGDEGDGHPEPGAQPDDNATDWEEDAQQEAAAEPEAGEPEDAPEPEPEPQPERGDVNIALRQEREEKRRLQDELAAYRARMDQFERMLQQQAQPPAPKEPEDPEPELPDLNDVGIEDWLKASQKKQAWKDRQQARETEQLRTFVDTEKQRREQDQQKEQLRKSIETSEIEFRAQAADYDQALQHLAAARLNELMADELLSPQDAQTYVLDEMMKVAAHRLAQNKSPARYFYEAAKLRGYTGEQPKSNGLAGTAHQQTQKTPAPAPQAAPQKAAQPPQQRRQVSDAAKAEANLAGASGAPTAGNTLQALIDADERDLFAGKVDYMKVLRGG